jgi:6-phosphogluconate dehydrogenase
MAAHFGMIGLGTMGSNLVLNIAEHGFAVCGYDREPVQRQKLMDEAKGKPINTVDSLNGFVEALETPRIIMLLVPAGKIVDVVIGDLNPLLQKGDVVIDGGNSHFIDTDRRYLQLQNSGIHFIGMGVSGGEEGARLGPSLMPGGNPESYQLVKNILEVIAAKTEDGPCVSYIGNTSAGHYTKMVHNGIEYAVMQLISEVYHIMKSIGNVTNQELQKIFSEWNKNELQSFLIEITADIFLKPDDITDKLLVDMILDKAKQKGTGMWTSQSAMDLTVPIPTIDSAVSMRYISSMKEERVAAAKKYAAKKRRTDTIDKPELVNLCRHALTFSLILSYAQGFHLLSVASSMYNYKINIAEVIRVWKGGCIIRSVLLNDMGKVYLENPTLPNLIQSSLFQPMLSKQRNDINQLLKIAMDHAIPTAALAASLNYFNAYCSDYLPANLIQAQRDYFGAHTYERIDQTGSFHTEWNLAPSPANEEGRQ